MCYVSGHHLHSLWVFSYGDSSMGLKVLEYLTRKLLKLQHVSEEQTHKRELFRGWQGAFITHLKGLGLYLLVNKVSIRGIRQGSDMIKFTFEKSHLGGRLKMD